MRDLVARCLAENPDGCWEWHGTRSPDGYGHVNWNGRICRVHRVAWEILRGPIPDGLQIDHLCKNKPCFNPKHLEPVTQTENMRRRWQTYAPTHCKHGHEWTPENTRKIRNPAGTFARFCNECGRIRNRAYKLKKKH